MHQNSPYWEPKSNIFFSGEGAQPPPHTLPPSAPSAPRSLHLRRSTSAPAASRSPPSALGVPVPFHLRLEHWHQQNYSKFWISLFHNVVKQVQIACAHIVVRKNFENLSISVENLKKDLPDIFMQIAGGRGSAQRSTRTTRRRRYGNWRPRSSDDFLGRLPKVDLIILEGEKCPSVRPYVRPSVHKKFLRFQWNLVYR